MGVGVGSDCFQGDLCLHLQMKDKQNSIFAVRKDFLVIISCPGCVCLGSGFRQELTTSFPSSTAQKHCLLSLGGIKTLAPSP